MNIQHVSRVFSLVLIGLIASVQVHSQNILAESSFTMEGIDEVEIRGSFCNVNIIGTDKGNTLKFEGEITGSNNRNYEIEHERSGSKLEIWVNSPGGGSWGSIRGELNLQVAPRTAIYAKNSSGNVFASGLNAEAHRLEASSGNVEAENIVGDLYLKASSGNLRLNSMVGNLRAKTSSGGQKLRSIVGDVDTESSSGRISLNEIEGDILAESSSGGIGVEAAKGGLEMEATSGDLTGEAVQLTKSSYFRTSSGNIKMDLINDVEELSFDLRASSGNLTVGQRRAGDRYLDRTEGRIEVVGSLALVINAIPTEALASQWT